MALPDEPADVVPVAGDAGNHQQNHSGDDKLVSAQAPHLGDVLVLILASKKKDARHGAVELVLELVGEAFGHGHAMPRLWKPAIVVAREGRASMLGDELERAAHEVKGCESILAGFDASGVGQFSLKSGNRLLES